jgi:putative redox protein
MERIAVRHEAGDRFRISIRGHEVVVDQPSPSGDDAGPTPTELFVASLTACAAFYARRFLARHGLPDGALTVWSTFAWAPDHSRVSAIELHVGVPDVLPDELESALRRAVERCTVHESIRHTPVVTCLIEKATEPRATAGCELVSEADRVS